MRNRLIIIFLVPMTLVLVVLAGAYAWSDARSVQQQAANEQLGDLSYFLPGARQALRTGSLEVIAGEMHRYSELFGGQIAVFDRSGSPLASAGYSLELLPEDTSAKVDLALSGRRSEPSVAVLPWELSESMLVEPVFDDRSVIGAVLISTSVEAPRQDILQRWALLLLACVLLIVVLVIGVFRLANWVLRPLNRVDDAIAAIEHGEMSARISDETGPPEMRRMISLFNKMADEIETVMTRQQEFAMNASHELRNPLGALLLRVENLAAGLGEEWEEEIENTREEGRRMSQILETLLGMARLTQRDSVFTPVDLVASARSRAEAWREVAGQRGIAIEVSAAQPVVSVTDRNSVETALDTVIDNALRFAPNGTSVEVAVTASEKYCELAIRDHGPGLEPAELARATTRFWRSERDQHVAGSGLGLAIANDLLAGLGGSIDVSVPEGGGLRVALRIPEGAS